MIMFYKIISKYPVDDFQSINLGIYELAVPTFKITDPLEYMQSRIVYTVAGYDKCRFTYVLLP